MSDKDSTALTVVEPESTELAAPMPSERMRRLVDAAEACRPIVENTAINLKGRRFIQVEGWETIATVLGLTPSIREVLDEPDGIKAIAELRTVDGTVIASGEGFVGDDEPAWAKRPKYARKGMAQTRAISRVCRNALAFVVTLINTKSKTKLETTPAEEMPGYGADAAEEAPAVAPVRLGSVKQYEATQTLLDSYRKAVAACTTDAELEAVAERLGGEHPSVQNAIAPLGKAKRIELAGKTK